MSRRSVPAFLAVFAAAPAPALAGEAGDSAEALAAASEVIVVTGTREQYGVDTLRSATRTDTPLVDVPQAISVVTARQIEDQAMRSLADVLRYVPGAMIGQGEGHRDQITIRGNNSTADFFVDGLRDDIQYYRPLYNLQRVEVLRGPNAMIFGRGGGGGIVNRVTKTPLLQPLLSGNAAATSFGGWQTELDLNQPVSSALSLRLNAVREEFASHRDLFEGRLIAANPAARLLLGPDTGIGLSYEYVDDERTVDRGIPSARAGTIADPALPLAGHRDTFFGSRDVNRTDFAAHIVRGTFEHMFAPELRLTTRLLYADYDKAYRNAFAATAVRPAAGGGQEVGFEAYGDAFQRENLFSQTDLVWRSATGGVSHTLLAGFEFGRQDTGNQRVNGFFGQARRVFVPVAERIALPAIEFRGGGANGERGTQSRADIFAAYAQEQAEIGPFELLAGIRYDRFAMRVDDRVAATAAARTDHLWSPRLGLVFHPVEDMSLYASYGRSFLPQSGDQFNSLDVTAAALEPERFDNYEIGAKWEPRSGFYLAAAAYRLDRANTRAVDPADPRRIVQTGEQRSRGIEVEAVGQLNSSWQLSAGYAYQEAEITRTTQAAPAGRQVPQVPRHQAFVWTRYDFAPGIGAGLGVAHQSRSFASISNAVLLPAFTRVDAGLFFRLAEGVEAQLNVENLLDAGYFPTAHNDNNITTGAPRNVRATVRLRF